MVADFALAGWLVRRFGARTLLCVSLAVVALGALGFVLTDSLALYFPARLLMGLGSGGIWIGVTFDTLERWPGQEYLCMSRIFAAYSVGGLIGSALGAFGGISGPFLVYLALLVLAVPLVLLVGEPAIRREFAADRAALRTRGFWAASAAILFAVLALGVLEGMLPLHFAERLSQAQIGALYVGASLIVALSANAAGGLQPRPLVSGALVLAVAGITLAGIANRRPALGARPAASRGRDRTGEHRLARPARRSRAGRADRDRDGRLVADRNHRLPAVTARRWHRGGRTRLCVPWPRPSRSGAGRPDAGPQDP
jgi:MFS family permease